VYLYNNRQCRLELERLLPLLVYHLACLCLLELMWLLELCNYNSTSSVILNQVVNQVMKEAEQVKEVEKVDVMLVQNVMLLVAVVMAYLCLDQLLK